MRWPFVSRRRYEDLAADRARLRGERDQFLKDRNAAQAAARTAARQFAETDEKYTDVCIVNECLTEELAAAREQLAAQAARTDMVPLADFEEQQKRADHLQARLDQALGLDAAAVAAGEAWQERREQKMRFDK